MKVTMIRYTTNPDELAARAASICTNTTPKPEVMLSALEQGHESILEHITFTFLIEDVSRVLLAQLTRHRIASFSVQSQRYVSYADGFGYVIPPSIVELGTDAVKRYMNQMETLLRWYIEWRDLLGKKKQEDARFVLPGACTTTILMTMNVRELRHFFGLRECEQAQWEIRQMAKEMHKLASTVAPLSFKGAGADCKNCREKRPCPRKQKAQVSAIG